MNKLKYISIGLLLLNVSCTIFEPAAPNNNQLLDGPVADLTPGERQQFLRGDDAFNKQIFTADNGLGPLFVATSCGSCHLGDGKGHPFTTLTRFGQENETGNKFLNQGGPQLQNHAIAGFTPEQVPAEAYATKLLPPANTGLGFLDAVSDDDILLYSDPNDIDKDSIRGVPNYVTLKSYVVERPNSKPVSGKYIARFGKKASTYNLLQQTAQAYNQDIGVTSTYEDKDTYSGAVSDPEVSNQTVADVVFYLRTLKAPISREQTNDVKLGGQLFVSALCEKCHRAEMKTGITDIAALSGKTFHPYSDLLLHNMGPGLNDNYTEGSAKASEWRTPPLWGLGLSKKSQGGQYYLLHDGRARSINEAILMHGGEAVLSIKKYQTYTDAEKKQLIQFLESL
jgi:CxxC motif-containing protein (DUF1111 family)